jgi:hypothetical protein
MYSRIHTAVEPISNPRTFIDVTSVYAARSRPCIFRASVALLNQTSSHTAGSERTHDRISVGVHAHLSFVIGMIWDVYLVTFNTNVVCRESRVRFVQTPNKLRNI